MKVWVTGRDEASAVEKAVDKGLSRSTQCTYEKAWKAFGPIFLGLDYFGKEMFAFELGELHDIKNETDGCSYGSARHSIGSQTAEQDPTDASDDDLACMAAKQG